MLPGEEPPARTTCLRKASLPPAERGSQRRFTQLERFNIFLAPDGRVTIPGPDVRRLPTSVEGTYRVLLRIEASDDRESDSNLGDAGAGTGILHNGAVAGFPLPVLRYVVAGEGARTPVDGTGALRLFAPRDGDTLSRFRRIYAAVGRRLSARVQFSIASIWRPMMEPLFSAHSCHGARGDTRRPRGSPSGRRGGRFVGG